MPASCGRGKIRRNSYRRKNGTTVKSTCVPDTGAPGKTPKSKRVLPKPDPRYSLKKFGYSTHNTRDERRKALRRASKAYGALPTLRRLNLVRNLQANVNAKQAMDDDVKFLTDFYRELKERNQKKGGSCKSRGTRSRKTRKTRGSRKLARTSRKGSRRRYSRR